jgi:hypothetical protein
MKGRRMEEKLVKRKTMCDERKTEKKEGMAERR